MRGNYTFVTKQCVLTPVGIPFLVHTQHWLVWSVVIKLLFTYNFIFINFFLKVFLFFLMRFLDIICITFIIKFYSF